MIMYRKHIHQPTAEKEKKLYLDFDEHVVMGKRIKAERSESGEGGAIQDNVTVGMSNKLLSKGTVS